MVRSRPGRPPFLAMDTHPESNAPVLHLVHGEPDPLVASVIEGQRSSGIPVDVVRCDLVADWGEVVDKVLASRGTCSW